MKDAKERKTSCTTKIVLVFCAVCLLYLFSKVATRSPEYHQRMYCGDNMNSISLEMFRYPAHDEPWPQRIIAVGEGEEEISWRTALVNDPYFLSQQEKDHLAEHPMEAPWTFRCGGDESAPDCTSYLAIYEIESPERILAVIELHGLEIKWDSTDDVSLEDLEAMAIADEIIYPHNESVHLICPASYPFINGALIYSDVQCLRKQDLLDWIKQTRELLSNENRDEI